MDVAGCRAGVYKRHGQVSNGRSHWLMSLTRAWPEWLAVFGPLLPTRFEQTLKHEIQQRSLPLLGHCFGCSTEDKTTPFWITGIKFDVGRKFRLRYRGEVTGSDQQAKAERLQAEASLGATPASPRRTSRVMLRVRGGS
jgi:hypothetical protein